MAGPGLTHTGKIAVAYPVDQILVDGELGDWPRDHPTYPIAYPLYGDSSKVESLRGEFRAGFDSTRRALYVAVEVDPGDVAIDACVLFLEPAHDPDRAVPLLFGAQPDSSQDTSRVQLATAQVAGSHRYEWRLDLGRLAPDTRLGPGVVLGFDVALWVVAPDSTSGVISWGPGKVKHDESEDLGDLALFTATSRAEDAALTFESVAATIDVPAPIDSRKEWVATIILYFFPLGVFAAFLNFFAKERHDGYNFVGVFVLTTLLWMAYTHDHFEAADLGQIFWIAALWFGALATLLLYSKVDPAFHRWKTRYFGELPPRWPNRWLVKAIIPGIVYAGLVAVASHYGSEMRDLMDFAVPAFLAMIVSAPICYRVESAWALALRKRIGYVVLCLLSAAVYFEDPLPWIHAFPLKTELSLLAIAQTGVAPVMAIRRRVEGRWVLGLGGLTFTVAMLYQLLSLTGWVPTTNVAYYYGFAALGTGMYVWVIRRFRDERREEARREAELEAARALQLSMLPDQLPRFPSLDIAWHMETATEVGGDYYDYTLAEDGTLTVTLGDATGHGLEAGTVVTATKSLFHSLSHRPDIVETFAVMSGSLKAMNLRHAGMAMTIVKVKGSHLQISSAGIPPMLWYRSATGTVEEVMLEGMPLGYTTSPRYDQREIALSPGDTMLLMSDGLPERLNPNEEEFGYQRVETLFAELAPTHPPDRICQQLMRGGEEWAAGRAQDDDITFVVLRAKTPISVEEA